MTPSRREHGSQRARLLWEEAEGLESELQGPGWPGDSVGGGICCLSAVHSPPAAPVSGRRTHLGASCISPGQTSLAHPEAGLGSLHTSLAFCGNLAGLPGEAEACAGPASQKGCGVPSLPSPSTRTAHTHQPLGGGGAWAREPATCSIRRDGTGLPTCCVSLDALFLPDLSFSIY